MKDESDKGKKGKKGKGKDEPVRKPPPQKQPQKPAVKKPVPAGGGDEEEQGAAEQEDKVDKNPQEYLNLFVYSGHYLYNFLSLIFFQEDDADQDNLGAEVCS